MRGSHPSTREDCCEYCSGEYNCPEMVARCRYPREGACETCLPCEGFTSRGPFISALRYKEEFD